MNNYRNWIIDAAMMVLYVLGAGINSIFTVMALIITVVELIRADNERIMEIQLLLVPFCGVMYLEGSFSLFNFILAISLLCLFLRKRSKTSYLVVELIIVLFAISLYTVLCRGPEAFRDCLTFSVGFLILELSLEHLNDFNVERITRKYSVGLVVSSLAYYFIDYLPGLNTYISNAMYRLEDSTEKIERFGGLVGNPNHYSLALNIAIAAILVLIMYRRATVFDYIMVVLMVIFGINTISNSFFLGLLATGLFMSIYLLFTSQFKLIIAGILVGITAMLYLTFSNRQYLDIILTRLSLSQRDTDLNLFTSGRIDHYRVYNNEVFGSLRIFFFGNGYGATINGLSSHNWYLESIYHFGAIGFFFLLHIIVKTCKSLRREGKGVLRFLVLFVLMFRGMAINLDLSMHYPYYIFMSALFVVAVFPKNKEPESNIQNESTVQMCGVVSQN